MILHVSSKTTDSKRHLGMQWGRFLWKPSGLVPTEQGWELLKFLNKWWVGMIMVTDLPPLHRKTGNEPVPILS